jgi:hypothetical protein
MMRIATFLTTAGLALFGTLVFAQDITYDFDRAANFSRFKTYSWVRGRRIGDELNHKRIVSAIDAQLASRGLTRSAAASGADLLVAYHANFDRDLQINGFSTGWGSYAFGPGRTGTARVEEILVGTLIVDLVDAKTETIVWRGTATKQINVRANPDERDKEIKKGTEKLFHNYPPRP